MNYRNIRKVLVSAGWIEVRVSGSHHQYRHPEYKDVVTVPCHGGKDISKGVLGRIQKVTGLQFQ